MLGVSETCTRMFLVTSKEDPLFYFDFIYRSDHCNAFPIAHLSPEPLYLHAFLMQYECAASVCRGGKYFMTNSSWTKSCFVHFEVKSLSKCGYFEGSLHVFAWRLFGSQITAIFPPLFLWKVVMFFLAELVHVRLFDRRLVWMQRCFSTVVPSPSLGLLLQDAPLSDCTDTIDGLDGSEGSYSPAKSIRKVLTAPVLTCMFK